MSRSSAIAACEELLSLLIAGRVRRDAPYKVSDRPLNKERSLTRSAVVLCHQQTVIMPILQDWLSAIESDKRRMGIASTCFAAAILIIMPTLQDRRRT